MFVRPVGSLSGVLLILLDGVSAALRDDNKRHRPTVSASASS
jgi:hypothetical protein